MGYFWTLYSAPLSEVFILSQIPHCLDYCCSTERKKSGILSSCICFFFFKTVLTILAPFPFHITIIIRTRNSSPGFFYSEKGVLLGIYMSGNCCQDWINCTPVAGLGARPRERKAEVLLTLSSLQGLYPFLDEITEDLEKSRLASIVWVSHIWLVESLKRKGEVYS